MTPSQPPRPAIGLPVWIAVFTLSFALAGRRSSSSTAVVRGVLPLELGRQFPELARLPQDAPAAALVEPADSASPSRRIGAPEVGPYLHRLPFGREIELAAREQRLDGLLVASVV